MEAVTTQRDALEREVASLHEKVVEISAENARLKQSNELLRQKLEKLLAARYGRSSEQLHPGQLRLFDVGAAPPTQPSVEMETVSYKRKKPQPGHGRSEFPAHLPRNEITIDPPEGERVCDCCGGSLVCIRREITERGDVIPTQIIVNRYDRGVWACAKGCGAPKTAEVPPTVVDKSKWEPSAYAHVVVAKYGDHLPLHRQTDIFRRHGIHFPKSTLCDMALAVAMAVRLIVERVRVELLLSPVLLADESPIPVIVDAENGNPKKRKVTTGYLWVYRTPGDVDEERIAFRFTDNRSRAGPKEFLANWQGTLLTDEYSGYDEVCRDNGIVRAGCWAHARRRFKDALESRPRESAEALRLINGLFRLERFATRRIQRQQVKATSQGLAPLDENARAEIRLAVRQRWSARLVDMLHPKLEAWRADPAILPKGLLGTAVRYLLPEAPRPPVWDRFTAFLHNGRVPIHNNDAENAIRPMVVGRKNWLLAGSKRGGDAAATLYSLLLTCRALNVNPEEYLADILSRLGSATPDQLTPWAWKKERAVREAREPGGHHQPLIR